MKILILCTGNSCRSQMAEGFLNAFDDRIKAVSAGTHPSGAVHPKAINVMDEMGISLVNHVPESVDLYIHNSFDYVITVCGSAKESCPNFTGNVKEKRHIGFEDPADATGTNEEIVQTFRTIRDEILRDFFAFYMLHIKPQL